MRKFMLIGMLCLYKRDSWTTFLSPLRNQETHVIRIKRYLVAKSFENLDSWCRSINRDMVANLSATICQIAEETANIFSSLQFSHSVVSDSLRPHESQHARPPCLSPTPEVYPNPCPSSRWCYPAISSSVVPSSSCPISFPALGIGHPSVP